jgi:hypothetical protein
MDSLSSMRVMHIELAPSDDPEQDDDQDDQENKADDSAWEHFRLLSMQWTVVPVRGSVRPRGTTECARGLPQPLRSSRHYPSLPGQ